MTLAHAIRQQSSVTFVIFLRELNTRFGRFRLGYLWAIAEPAALVAIISFVRTQFGRGPISGVDYPLFFASGVIAYLIFTHIVNSSLAAIESNQGLFNYRQVKPFDVILARSLLELVSSIGAGLVVFLGLTYLDYSYHWNSTLGLASTVAMLFCLALGFGLITAVLGPLYQDSKKIVPIMLRPLFFLSGIFFSAESIPEPYRSYLLINPLLHVTELVRHNMFKEFTSNHGSYTYLGAWALCSLFAGLMVYRTNRIKILTSGNIK